MGWKSGHLMTTLNSSFQAAAFWNRLSTTDGEFTAFMINTAVPLVIEYRVVLTFS